MLYILYLSAEESEVLEKVIPLVSEEEYKLIPYPDPDFRPQKEDATMLTYLEDEYLKEFLPRAASQQWSVGILPHPENEFTTKGLGITTDMEQAISQIISTEGFKKLDLLFCNEKPIFQSVNLGAAFLFSEEQTENDFFSEVVVFIRNLRRFSSLSHNSYLLHMDEKKFLHTSALGIIVVEHSQSSVVARRLISKSALNDGMFNVFILAPQNLLELFFFLLRSLLPKRKKLGMMPSFIGHIKTDNLQIESHSPIEYTLDGIKDTAKRIELKVHPEALRLRQKSRYSSEKNGPEPKKSFRTDKLPTGEKREELTKRSLPILPRATTEEFQDLFKVLRENSRITSPYIVMMILSTLIATFGLFANSSPVIIGAMILAPIIAPIVSFSMGMVRYNTDLLKKGIVTILVGTLVSLLFSAAVALLLPLRLVTSEIEARLTPTLLDMGIAVASGMAAAYAHAKEGIAKSLAGVAIAVALVPPLAVSGIGIGWWDWEVFSGAFLLYLTNLAGIIMFAGLTFLVLGFAPFKRAKMGLLYTFILITLVMVPLSFSFNRIKQEARITRQLEGIILNEVLLRDVKVRLGNPLRVSLKLIGTQNLDGDALRAIKKEIEKELKQEIHLEVVPARSF